jgi:hypothetical protein
MRLPEWIHRLIISILFSIINWKLVDFLIIDIGFIKYILIEISILGMAHCLIFVYKLTGIEPDEKDEQKDTH